MNRKILFYHGLGGEADSDTSYLFGTKGFQTIQHTHDYELEWMFDKMEYFFKKQLYIAGLVNPDVIIGNSYGGYVAYNIARLLSKPVLLINPALDRDLTKTSLKHAIFPKGEFPKEIPIEIFLGIEDIVVPNKITTDYVKVHAPHAEIFYLNGGHNIDYYFFKKMLKQSGLLNPKKNKDFFENMLSFDSVLDVIVKQLGKQSIITRLIDNNDTIELNFRLASYKDKNVIDNISFPKQIIEDKQEAYAVYTVITEQIQEKFLNNNIIINFKK